MYIFASGKEPACQCRRHKRHGSIPGWGRYPGGGHGNPFQYSCLENPMNREAWQATVHSIAKSQTWLKWLSTRARTLWKGHRPSLHLRNGDYEQDGRSFPSLSPHVCMLGHFSHVRLFATLWTIACQAPLSMGFSRQEYCSGLPCPPLGDLPNPGIQPHLFCLLHWQAGSWPLVPPGKSLISTQQHQFWQTPTDKNTFVGV